MKDEEKLSLLFLVRTFSRKTTGSIKMNMFSFVRLTWNQIKAVFSSLCDVDSFLLFLLTR